MWHSSPPLSRRRLWLVGKWPLHKEKWPPQKMDYDRVSPQSRCLMGAVLVFNYTRNSISLHQKRNAHAPKISLWLMQLQLQLHDGIVGILCYHNVVLHAIGQMYMWCGQFKILSPVNRVRWNCDGPKYLTVISWYIKLLTVGEKSHKVKKQLPINGHFAWL